ncbi:receptor-transporting protein 3-like [Carcharodon carcharias]|uniref:receptor-transporting protein 3-like n=1 Tax=Carcharodon carcharias TaxID=13397 RepID=UPI001B7E4B3D|nr:receptor-transporting protein 3-like [Carcharodon carcharias]
MTRTPGRNPWIDSFTRYMDEQEYGEKWTLNFNYNLQPYLEGDQKAKGWKVYQTSSFGRFECHCSNSWSSAHVVILFHYRLRRNRGLVLLRLFKQSCRYCVYNAELKPQVNHNQMQNVFNRLIFKIRKNCYRETVEEVERDLRYRKTKPHETSLCEACHLGICRNKVDVVDNTSYQ